MLSKPHRLKTQKDFDFVYKHGKKFASKHFILYVASQKQSNLPEIFKLPRFGFVASKKVGKAVQRNRSKRLLRAIIREEIQLLKTDFEAIFIAFNTLPEIKHVELQKEIRSALTQLNLYKKDSSDPEPESSIDTEITS